MDRHYGGKCAYLMYLVQTSGKMYSGCNTHTQEEREICNVLLLMFFLPKLPPLSLD